ncbi:tetratricopeptide repeat protein [Coleofasciculus sp. LEGE 07092]|nr:tetratricopeptide repeat protein [Coleofasciculus sp. LEGE 07081]MBE9149802.1 tetratricopeptide repeat protein [Coleofasciculus sp. LEGE 07092]
MPLGLQLVGHYLAKKPEVSLSTVLRRLDARQRHDRETTQSETTLKWRVEAALELVWQELDLMAQQVAQLLGLFAPTAFPWEWVEIAVSESLNWQQADIERAKNQLKMWHLMESVIDRENCYKIQPIIRDFFQHKLNALESPATLLSRFSGYRSGALSQESVQPPNPIPLPELPDSENSLETETVQSAEWHPTLSMYPYKEFSGNCCIVEEPLQFVDAVPAKLDPNPQIPSAPSLQPSSEDSLSKEKQRWQQEHIQADDLRRAFAAAVIKVVQGISDSPTPQDIESLKEVIPHLQEIAQMLQTAARDEELLYSFDNLGKFYKNQELADLLWLFDKVGRFYKSQGLYGLAEPWFVQCLAIAKAALGEDHLDVSTSLNNLAGLYYCQERYREAQSLYQQALDLRKRLLGAHHIDVATSLNNLASVYYAQGCYSEAEPLYLQTLELRRRILSNNHPDIATSLNNLGLLYYVQRRYREAEPLYMQALELRKRILNNNHPDVATSLNNLAGLYKAQRRYAEAEPLLVQALEVSERVLGVDHPNSAIFRKNLSVLRTKLQTGSSWFQRIFSRDIPPS